MNNKKIEVDFSEKIHFMDCYASQKKKEDSKAQVSKDGKYKGKPPSSGGPSSEKDFKPHMMYDPKTGKGYMAKTYEDHLKMKKMGYKHDKSEGKKKKKY